MLLFFSYEKIFEQFHVVQLFDENFGMQILIAYSINLNYFLLSYQLEKKKKKNLMPDKVTIKTESLY